MYIYSIIVKAPDPAQAVALAKEKLGGLSVVRGTDKPVTPTEVQMLVQCPIYDLQAWFSEDVDQDPPFPEGSLLLFSPWAKNHSEQIHQAKQELGV